MKLSSGTSRADVRLGPLILRPLILISVLALAALLRLGLLMVGGDDEEIREPEHGQQHRLGSWALDDRDGESRIIPLTNEDIGRWAVNDVESPVAPLPDKDSTARINNSQVNDDGATKEGESYNETTSNKITHSIRTDNRGSYWTESHSPRNQSINRDVRISFRLHDPDEVPYPRNFLSVHGYMCFGGSLPSSISERSVLNFTTTISTDLNILFIGDSISQQFAQGFYSSLLGEAYMGSHVITRSFINGQHFPSSGLHVCSSIVAPTRGGGASAYWRVLELMSNRTEAPWYVNCKKEKGWLLQDGKKLSRHRFPYPPIEAKNDLVKVNTSKNNGATTWYRTQLNYNESQQQLYQVGGFDCCVLRLQHGWMELHEITRERIVDEIELCNKVVGAKSVIISTLPLNNNILTVSDWESLININQIIRDIARTWNPPSPGNDGIQWVLVQEFGNFTNQILWWNAHHIGYNITIPDFTKNDGWEKKGAEFLLHRYQGIKSMKLAPSIPMVCAHHIEQPFSTKNKTAGQCFFNKISRDGMHWCIEALGSRFSANIACLLGCVYNGKEPQNTGELRKCEQECNDQFMSLIPVDQSWIGTNTTIFGKT
ncbi:hypothetical protein ACHAXR_007926 [Thalassiosira sp. AJA248-18]